MKPNNRWIFQAACWLAALAAPISGGAAIREVDIAGFAFSPANLTINAGDTVRWTQKDDSAHTTTSGANGVEDGKWDSGLMTLQNNTVFSFTFTTAGTYPYFCAPHRSFMRGTITVLASTNAPPSVALTNPVAGARFTAPANVQLAATASDSDGSIAQVEFFDGTTSLGVVTAAPYQLTVILSAGGHDLTAAATDNQGTKVTSATVNITVGSPPIDNPIAERIPKGELGIELITVADGLISPLGLATPNDGSGRMFVYDQAGVVWVITAAGKLPEPLLDVRARLVPLGAYDERGLLGMALHPNFAQNPLIYTYTSEPNAGMADFMIMYPGAVTNNHQSVIAEWRIDTANPNRVDPASRRELLRLDQPQSNHNGGTMRFGPDGFLYISLGDGGAADDQGDGHPPGGNGQDIETIYGSVVRIDVNGSNGVNGRYGVPADNPFVGKPGVDEIYAYGLRNPFNFSFDRITGELYLADVGQNKVEEINKIVKGGNYGWNIKEGTFFFDPNGNGAGYVTETPVRPVPEGLVDPIAQYDHDDGLAAVGGFVYRGSQITTLQGRYIFGDWGSFSAPSGRLFYLDAAGSIKEFRLGLEDRPLGLWIKGFGEDAAGELYVFGSRTLGPNGNTGKMLRIVGQPEPLRLTGMSASGAVWTGGLGPFALQKKDRITDAYWINAGFTDSRNTPVAFDSPAGFFRVADTAHLPAIPFTAAMSGSAERPNPLTNNATGSGTFSLDGDTLKFSVRYAGLSGPAIGAHIHGPAPASGFGNVLVDLQPYHQGPFGTEGTFSGLVILSPSQKAAMLAGLTYVNVHTEANRGGELRGQIAPVLMQTALSSANERPIPNETTGIGSGTFMLVGNQLSFNLTYSGLSAVAIAAHIHGPASSQQATNVLVDLAPFHHGAMGTSGSFSGSVTLTPDQLAYVIDGLTYVNVHTTTHQGGEIRGQILAQSTAVPLTTLMSGLNERPTPVTNNASGTGTFSLEGNILIFNVRYQGLPDPATAAHIHGPSPTSGFTNVLIGLAGFNGGAFGTEGTFSGMVKLSPEQRSYVLSGQTYINVHTGPNPGGALRGQIVPVLMRADLSGANQRPAPVATEGLGVGFFTLVWDQLNLNVSYSRLSGNATAARIYGPASPSQNVSTPLIDLAPLNGGNFGTAGSLSGRLTLNLEHLAYVIDGLTYVNFLTGNNPGGEIRGQITR